MMKMNKEECQLYSDKNCLAQDLEPCDYEGDYKQCLRYRVYFLRPPVMQLR